VSIKWTDVTMYICTDKKEIKIFLIYKEIQMGGSVAKSYMRKGFVIYEEMRKYLTINMYKKAGSHIYMTLQSIPSEFPYI
jgi:hypothetical protein